MSDIAIKFENVSKLYELGTVGTGTLSHDLKRWWITSVLHKEDPYLKIGETNDRSTKGDSKFVYALKDIDFEVKQGDVLGIIGKNGAGKSTLLKLLSRVTAPTTGKIYTKGRIASLLEVGTGFHPELTGRENIYMNGTILGMKKWEIEKQLDAIVDFSGCERYLDTPVKRYSSGMTVRLGFAIAAHLNPEILVVDEVLAVGDAEFQKKAIGKMQDVSKGEGRTVLFVSHNMNSVKMLCQHGVVLKNGMIDKMGSVGECVDYYLETMRDIDIISRVEDVSSFREHYEFLVHGIDFVSVEMLNEHPEALATDEPLRFRTKMKADHRKTDFQLCIFFINASDVRVQFCMTTTLKVPADRDVFYIETEVPNHHLPKGRYFVRFETNNQEFSSGSTHFDFIQNVLSFEIKYVHKKQKDEYLFWQPSWGQTLLIGSEQVFSKIL